MEATEFGKENALTIEVYLPEVSVALRKCVFLYLPHKAAHNITAPSPSGYHAVSLCCHPVHIYNGKTILLTHSRNLALPDGPGRLGATLVSRAQIPLGSVSLVYRVITVYD